MDTTKKVEVEKRIVIGLSVVFAISLFMGPLKSLRPSRAVPTTPHGSTGEPSRTSPQASGLLEERASVPVAHAVSASAERPSGVDASARAGFYTAQDLRDPFTSLLPVTPPAPTPEHPVVAQDLPHRPVTPTLQLQGVLWGGMEPQAIINHNVYHVGDAIDGATVTAIDRDGVTIDVEGTTMMLTTREAMDDAAPKGAQRR